MLTESDRRDRQLAELLTFVADAQHRAEAAALELAACRDRLRQITMRIQEVRA